jgi:hypothetical protein
VFPAFAMSVCHLRFQEATKNSTLDRPSDSIALLNPTLDYEFILRQAVYINPNALIKNQVSFEFGMLVFLKLGSSGLTPKTLTTTMCVFT